MKLLLFSDLHCNVDAAKAIATRAAAGDIDALIGAGDFANLRTGIDRCIDVLQNVERPTVLVAGNNESTDELRHACRRWPEAHVLHGTAVTLSGVTFFGLGGGVPVTPFGAWSYDFSEDDARSLLASCPDGCVLISHSPPKGAVDVASNGISLGSTAVREAIERTHPRLVVCGHIHASAGQTAMIDQTPVINAGPRAVEFALR